MVATTIVDPAFATRVARAYMDLPAFDASALPAYRAFSDETLEQYRHLTRTLGITVLVTERDPYASAAEMMADIDDNRRLFVWSTARTGAHPYLLDYVNDAFRAVHDYFGHYCTRNGFDRHGEETAYRAHRMMYSARAVPALTTETRGQNSAFIFHFNGDTFPPQRVALLPDWAHALY